MRLSITFAALAAASLISLITGWHRPLGMSALFLMVIVLGWTIVFTKVK